jgi:hypothetical protein
VKQRIGIALALVACIAGVAVWRMKRRALAPATSEGATAKAPQQLRVPPRRLDPDAPRGGIEGRVVSADGKPVEGALVAAIAEEGEGARRPVATARTLAGGAFRLDNVMPGGYVVSATAPGRAAAFRAGLTVLPGETLRGVEIKLGAAGVTISGFVRDSGGGPIARPEVRASRHSSDTGDLFQVIGNDDGAYAITVPSGSYTLAADADGYAPADKLVLAQADQRVDFQLNPAATLRGKVVDRATQAPIPSATVKLEAKGLAERERSATADGNGVFELRDVDPGSYQLVARSGPLVGYSKQVDVTLGAYVSDLVIECDRGRTLSGHVTSARGPVAGARLSLRGAGLAVRSGPPTATSGSDGAYRIEGISPGHYELHVSAKGFAPTHDPDVKLDQRDLTRDVTLDSGATVSGKVLDADGKPVEGAAVTAWVAGGGLIPRGYGTDRSAADGAFSIHDLGTGTLRLDASHPDKGGGQLEAALAAGEQKTVELRLAGGATVTGVVRWDDGSPAVDVTVQAMQLPSASTQARTGEGGVFKLTGLGKGTIRLFASRKDADLFAGYAQGGPAVKTLTLEPNEHASGVELVLDRGGKKISGIVLGPDGQPLPGAGVGAKLERSGESQPRVRVMGMGDSAKAFSGADGSFTLEDLSKGSYTVWATHAGLPEAEVRAIAADSSGVRVQFKPAASIAGVVVGNGGKPVTDFSIAPLSRSGPVEQQRVMAMLGGDRQTVHDPTGAFVLSGLAGGSYDISVNAPDGRVGKLSGVELADGEQKRGITIAIGKGVTLKGRAVELAAGTPIAGARVMVTAGAQPISATTDDKGAFQVDGAAPGVASIMIMGDVGAVVPDQRDVTVGTADLDLGSLKLLRANIMSHLAADVGIRANNRDGNVTVLTVRPGSPADKAGVKAGEPIASVDGQDVSELGAVAVAYLLGGAPGTSVKVTLGSRTLTLQRESH